MQSFSNQKQAELKSVLEVILSNKFYSIITLSK
jgi:hypothetical protein